MKFQLKDLVDIKKIQIFLEKIYFFTGMPCKIIDSNANILARIGDNCCDNWQKKHKLLKLPIIFDGIQWATIIQATSPLGDISNYDEEKNKFMITLLNEFIEIVQDMGSRQLQLLRKQSLLLNKERDLQEIKQRYEVAVLNSDYFIWEWDFKNNELYLSQNWTNIEEKLVGKHKNVRKSVRYLIHPQDRKTAIADLKRYLRGKTLYYQSEFRIKTPDGYKYVYNKGKGVKDSNENMIKMLGSMIDITERKQMENEIRHMAYYDSLTNLPNRTFFANKLEETLQKAKEKGKKEAVIFIDVDEFKKVNDSLGHDYGDQFLKIIASILESCIEKEDFVARISGDEFIILLTEIKDSSRIINICERIINVFKNPLEIGNNNIFTSVSMGISIFPDDGKEAKTLLKKADTAMRNSKVEGKNKYCFFTSCLNEKLNAK